VLWETASQEKYCCSPKIKHFPPLSILAGYATGHIHAFSFKTVQINLQYSLMATADTADMVSYMYSKLELSERNFCDSLEIKLTSTLGGIQEAVVPEMPDVSPFYLRLVITSG